MKKLSPFSACATVWKNYPKYFSFNFQENKKYKWV